MKRIHHLTFLGIFFMLSAHAQKPPVALDITAPANGTIVHPGDTIQVTVTPLRSPGGPAIQQVFLGGEGMGFSNLQTAPFQFNWQIPATTPPGTRLLYAGGL